MSILPIPPRRLVFHGVAVTLGLLMWAKSAAAQVQAFVQPTKAVGVGIWYGIGRFTVDGAAGNATDEVKGYTDVFPRDIDGAGPAIGFSFKSWGVVIGHTESDTNLKNKQADVKQTPADPTDDVTVRSFHAAVTSITLLYQPARWFYLGYGRDQGTIEFRQVSPTGLRETRRISVNNPFYSVGLAVGFDPTKHEIAPIATIFAKIPAEQGPFSGKTQGVGIGIYF